MTGRAEAQFDLDDHRTKDELTAAISALPAISERGSDISSAMRTLRTNVLSFGWRGYNNYIQKVALTFTDDRATNSRELAAAHQV